MKHDLIITSTNTLVSNLIADIKWLMHGNTTSRASRVSKNSDSVDKAGSNSPRLCTIGECGLPSNSSFDEWLSLCHMLANQMRDSTAREADVHS